MLKLVEVDWGGEAKTSLELQKEDPARIILTWANLDELSSPECKSFVVPGHIVSNKYSSHGSSKLITYAIASSQRTETDFIIVSQEPERLDKRVRVLLGLTS